MTLRQTPHMEELRQTFERGGFLEGKANRRARTNFVIDKKAFVAR